MANSLNLSTVFQFRQKQYRAAYIEIDFCHISQYDGAFSQTLTTMATDV
ncbi:hypothetical protein SAMN05216466_113205 [Paraburkholderia phenazinium]|uniref:Uncharacterized protein n=1 Tax=Paraburkholderia phenazinium TaxID=60549 RepID=A0A1G8FJ01_9BURK|nr:hypothetical protein SAMN05216466_113205 [Paraburkholderia phenazinium]